MITLGLRAKPDNITFALFDSEASTIINVEKFLIPNALTIPESLKYVRNTILDILREYGVSKAGIRITEAAALKPNIKRIQYESVIQEAFASSQLEDYYCGQIANIAAKIGIQRADFKRYVEGALSYATVENWGDLTPEAREAVFTAIGAVDA